MCKVAFLEKLKITELNPIWRSASLFRNMCMLRLMFICTRDYYYEWSFLSPAPSTFTLLRNGDGGGYVLDGGSWLLASLCNIFLLKKLKIAESNLSWMSASLQKRVFSSEVLFMPLIVSSGHFAFGCDQCFDIVMVAMQAGYGLAEAFTMSASLCIVCLFRKLKIT